MAMMMERDSGSTYQLLRGFLLGGLLTGRFTRGTFGGWRFVEVGEVASSPRFYCFGDALVTGLLRKVDEVEHGFSRDTVPGAERAWEKGVSAGIDEVRQGQDEGRCLLGSVRG